MVARSRSLAVALAVALGLLHAVDAAAGPGETAGKEVFDPRAASPVEYRMPAWPVAHTVRAADGTKLHIDTWLPVDEHGNPPDHRIPTVAVMSTYDHVGVFRWDLTGTPLIERGYAFSQVHARGTGGSGGCFDTMGPTIVDDAARVIEFLGRDAPWSDGNIGLLGDSYEGDIQLAVAALGDPERTKYLKAMVPLAPSSNSYEIIASDGVPRGIGMNMANLHFNHTYPTWSSPTDAEAALGRPSCTAGEVAARADWSGDFTPYWAAREVRLAAHNVRAATLLIHGLADQQRDPAPFFDLIPDDVPKVMLTGWWGHEQPWRSRRKIHPEWQHADREIVIAWFDRFLKGLDVPVEEWPRVQVQGSDGRWRVEDGWPATGGPAGHLALGAGGALGADAPTGATTYRETLTWQNAPGETAVFQTAPLTERLELTGQPVLDLWVTLDRPDAHVAARLEIIGADGTLDTTHFAVGTRSARHLEPIVDGVFTQSRGTAPAVGVPLRIPIRFDVTDLVVPPGARLRVTVAGSVENEEPLLPVTEDQAAFAYSPFYRYTAPSGLATNVTILHDCAHVSALRFLMPERVRRHLDIREAVERPVDPVPLEADGGIATTPVCGTAPVDPAAVASGR